MTFRFVYIGFYLTLILSLTAGCGFNETENLDEEFQQRLDNARAVWQAQELDNYTLRYERLMGQDGRTITSTVRADTILEATNSQGQSVPAANALTVEQYFAVIENNIGRDHDRFAVDFSDDQGYPLQLFVDNDGTANDEVINTLDFIDAADNER